MSEFILGGAVGLVLGFIIGYAVRASESRPVLATREQRERLTVLLKRHPDRGAEIGDPNPADPGLSSVRASVLIDYLEFHAAAPAPRGSGFRRHRRGARTDDNR